MAKAVLLFALLLLPFRRAAGQDLVTTEWVYLRRSPSMTGARLRELPPNDTLSIRDVPSRNSFIAVRTKDGKAGWVGERYLRDLHFVPVAANLIETDANGLAFNEIDPDWEKLPPVPSDIRVKGGTEVCKPEGEGSDDGTNVHKNRSDLPDKSHLITLDAIRALPDTALWTHNRRSGWNAVDSALVVPYEGIPVTVEGFFEIVKPQATSAPTGNNKVGESPNCHSWAEADTDWHIALVAAPNETEDRAVVVEPTPRTKRRNPGWMPAAAKTLAVRKSPSSPRNESGASRVRVTGFMMLDPVHPTHIEGGCARYPNCHATKFFRATLWEIHPVTRIEVLRNNSWVDLNQIPPQ